MLSLAVQGVKENRRKHNTSKVSRGDFIEHVFDGIFVKSVRGRHRLRLFET